MKQKTEIVEKAAESGAAVLLSAVEKAAASRIKSATESDGSKWATYDAHEWRSATVSPSAYIVLKNQTQDDGAGVAREIVRVKFSPAHVRRTFCASFGVTVGDYEAVRETVAGSALAPYFRAVVSKAATAAALLAAAQ